MPYGETDRSSIAVPIILVAFACAITIALVRQVVAVDKLDRVDRIACQFLNADATVRSEQAQNSSESNMVRGGYIDGIDQLIALVNKAPATKRTKDQAAGQMVFLAYLKAQRDLTQNQQDTSAKNIALANGLVVTARKLARLLDCTKGAP